jgi:hypothetical protein
MCCQRQLLLCILGIVEEQLGGKDTYTRVLHIGAVLPLPSAPVGCRVNGSDAMA